MNCAQAGLDPGCCEVNSTVSRCSVSDGIRIKCHCDRECVRFVYPDPKCCSDVNRKCCNI